jgi:hypothetical protein
VLAGLRLQGGGTDNPVEVCGTEVVNEGVVVSYGVQVGPEGPGVERGQLLGNLLQSQ